MSFATLASLPAKEIFGGIIRGHYAHLEKMTIGEVELAPGSLLPLHSHPHEQITYVIAGRLEFTVGAQTTILGPGMVALIPGGLPLSGGQCFGCCANGGWVTSCPSTAEGPSPGATLASTCSVL